MRTLIALFLFTGLAILPCHAQFNRYKYFVVPKRFEIFKDANQYQSSTLVKFLLTKYGYEAVYDDAIPEELFLNKCLGVTVQLAENSSFLQTRVAVVFLDCVGREVYRTPEGTSKIKEYKEAYSECIQEAMDVMAILKYEYEGGTMGKPPSMEAPPEPAIEKTEDAPYEATTVSSETAQIVSTEETESLEDKDEIITEPIRWSEAINQNGYILSDLDSGETWVLMRTSDASVYLAYSQNKQGIAFKQSVGWNLEYYVGDDRQEFTIRTGDQ